MGNLEIQEQGGSHQPPCSFAYFQLVLFLAANGSERSASSQLSGSSGDVYLKAATVFAAMAEPTVTPAFWSKIQ